MKPDRPVTASEREWASLLIKRLRRRSIVRKLVNVLLHLGRCPESADVDLLLKKAVEASNWRERALAAWLLSWTTLLEESDRQQVSQTLCEVLKRRVHPGFWNRSWWVSFGKASALWIGFVGFFFFAATFRSPGVDVGVGLWLADAAMSMLFILVLLSPLIAVTSFALEAQNQDHVRSAAASALGSCPFIDNIGVLAGAARDPNYEVSLEASKSLVGVLKHLTPEHFGKLGLPALDSLCNVLDHHDSSVLLAVLDALRLVGNGRTVAPVERLASASEDAAVRKAAMDVLPILKARQQRENDPLILVRPAVVSSQNTLLRPAQGVIENDPQKLLRPVSYDNQA